MAEGRKAARAKEAIRNVIMTDKFKAGIERFSIDPQANVGRGAGELPSQP
jgi:hypothetical protein